MSVADPYQPSICPEPSRSATHPRFGLSRLALVLGSLKVGLQLLQIVRMNRRRPAQAQCLFRREARIFQPTLAEEIAQAVGRGGPDQRGNVVYDASHLPFGLPGFLLGCL